MKDGQKIQIHNWIIEKVEMDGVDFMEVRTVTGDFRVMYRIGNHMFGLLDSDAENEDVREGLFMVFTNTLASATVLDVELHKDIMTAVSNYLSRAGKPSEISDEDDKQIIAEEKAAYELEQEMKEGKKDEK